MNLHMVFIFQDYVLFPHLSVEGNVALALPPRERQKAREYLERFSLLRLRTRRPGELSGCERVAIAAKERV
jgi:ABC-type Fe3+/spermidine/putrescine transport system ATPase subunit